MCMPYLGKLFGGGSRRRNNVAQTPRHSLAPTPQQSNATIQTVNTASLSQVKNELAVSVNASHNASLAEGSIQDAAGSLVGQPCVNQELQAPASPSRPTSWWEFFGINKNKKTNNPSL